MIQLDYGDHRPLYEQIKEKIKELIISGILKEDDKIPSVRDLASSLAINPNTIQKAYRDLESDGYIYSVRAKGSFVAPQKEIQKRNDIEEIMTEFKNLLSKLKFLGVKRPEIITAVDEEFSKREDLQ